ncbi:MAG: hypothetical protein KF905_16740 [Flavobacteriales bacterium]|nr:hypothetical protein [Flavobacteriales bacterium]
MDLKTTKQKILDHIAKIDDKPRLLALKRWCDRQDQYFDRNWKVVPPSIAVDSELPMFRVTKKSYTAAEVRVLLDEVRLTFESDEQAPFLSQKEIARLDKDAADMKSGKVKGIPWEEVKKRLEKKISKAKAAPKKAAAKASTASKRSR